MKCDMYGVCGDRYVEKIIVVANIASSNSLITVLLFSVILS